jgi:hypothetical protein
MTEDIDVLQSLVHDLNLDYPDKLTLLDHFAGLALNVMLVPLAQQLKPVMRYTTYPPDSTQTEPDIEATIKRDEDLVKRAINLAYNVAEVMLMERAKRMSK